MAEIEWEANPKRASLHRAIRHQLPAVEPSLRIVAEDFLGAESRMGFLGIGAAGELVSLRVGGDVDDRQILTHSLSDLVWLRSRTEDLFKLVPGLGIQPGAEARALLICPDFQADTRSAIQNFSAGRIALFRYRCYRLRGQLSVMLEAQAAPQSAMPAAESSTIRTSTSAPADASSGAAVPRPAGVFRTGLSDADLRGA